MNDIDKATEVLWHDTKLECFRVCSDAKRVAESLSAAGLLRTDADRLNAELAEAMVAYCGKFPLLEEHVTLSGVCHERDRVSSALRAILDALKPKERWTVGSAHGAPTVLCDGRVSYVLPCGFEPEARAYVARKNAEGAK